MANNTNTKNYKRIKPLGWLFIAVFAVIGVSLLGLLIQPLTSSVRTLPTGVEAKSTAPTITPYAQPTNTLAPTATALPDGWTQGKNLNGQAVLVPPEAIKSQLESLFKAVVDCNYTEDASDNELLAANAKASEACTTAQQQSLVTTIAFSNVREITKLGPVNPIQCADLQTCTLVRAKLGFFGAVLHDQKACGTRYKNGGCIYRGTETGGLDPYLILTVTLKQENGTWKLAQINREKLPGPPPSP